MKKNYAPLAWIIGIGGMLAYEFWSLANDIPGDTLSEAVWAISSAYPLAPFAVGILCGHFFWTRRCP